MEFRYTLLPHQSLLHVDIIPSLPHSQQVLDAYFPGRLAVVDATATKWLSVDCTPTEWSEYLGASFYACTVLFENDAAEAAADALGQFHRWQESLEASRHPFRVPAGGFQA